MGRCRNFDVLFEAKVANDALEEKELLTRRCSGMQGIRQLTKHGLSQRK